MNDLSTSASDKKNVTKRIRELNDRFRKRLPVVTDIPGRVMLTVGIKELCSTEAEPMVHLPALFELIRTYDDFNYNNDPHAEHDFGNFKFQGETCFWKTEYYAPDMMSGAEDPSDPHRSFRVITIMLAREY